MGLEKAMLVNLDESDKSKKEIKCLFNPSEIKISKSNNWQAGSSGGKSSGKAEFKGGGSASMQLQLFFDTYHTAKGASKVEDVRNHTNKVWQLMMVDAKLKDKKTKNGRPPRVRLVWGKNITPFEGIIKSISQTLNLFTPEGKPVRATLDLTIEQYSDENQFPMQNPTSGSIGGERVWVVQGGDTLAWIAHQELGDATQWRQIADANRLTQVRQLRPGQVLMIPVE